MKGVTVGGRNINNLCYADDTVLLAENEADLQNLLNVIREKSTEYGLNMNVKKTKVMVISKKRHSSQSTYPLKWTMLKSS